MHPKQASSVRPLGQRSIPLTFLFRSKNRAIDCKASANTKPSNEKGSAVSLSEFLNRKLHKSTVLPGSVQGKQRPFSSPMGYEDVNSRAKVETVGKRRGKTENDFALDIVIQQFKDAKREKANACSADNEPVSANTDDEQESRKRTRGEGEIHPKKFVAVLGDDSETPQRKKKKNLAINQKPVPLFNHYANGGGWWDCDMEGVDNEEVGCTDVWEGMGSTTLGGLDWH